MSVESKIYCPKCEKEWYEDDKANIKIKVPGDFYCCSNIKIKDMVFCPSCLFGKKTGDYRAKADKVILKPAKIKLTHIVVQNEFGDYINMPLDQLADLSHTDPGGQTKASDWGKGDDYESDGTCDYITGQGEPA